MSSSYDYSSQLSEIQSQNAATISSYFSSLSSSSSSSTSSTSSSSSSSSVTSLLPSTSSTTFGSVVDNLSDYGLIKGGSYSKLMKAYYKNVEGSDSSSSDSTTSLVMAKDDAKSLKSATNALSSLNFDKVSKTTTNDDGTTTTTSDYDKDSMYKAASEFVKSYNSMVESFSDLNSTTILKNGVHMTNQTAASEESLSKIGISINSDNTLSIDEDTFKSADINDIKTMFKGANSYASQIGKYATSVYNLSANAALTQTTGSRVYTQAGNYTDITDSTLYDSLL